MIVCLLWILSVWIQVQKYGLLLKRGQVIDPKNEIHDVMNVIIVDNISTQRALRVVNASGTYVTPGLVDSHTHNFYGVQSFQRCLNTFDGMLWETDLNRWSMNTGLKDMETNAKVSDFGHLSEGAGADVAVFRVLEGDFGSIDSRRRVIQGNHKLQAELTLRSGRLVWDLNGLAALHGEEVRVINKAEQMAALRYESTVFKV